MGDPGVVLSSVTRVPKMGPVTYLAPVSARKLKFGIWAVYRLLKNAV